jgi:hypothetical protein
MYSLISNKAEVVILSSSEALFVRALTDFRIMSSNSES